MYCTYCTDILCTIRYQLHELHVGVCMYMCVSSVAMCCVCTCVYPRIHHIFETNCGKLIRTDCNKGSNWSRQLSIEVDLVVLLLLSTWALIFAAPLTAILSVTGQNVINVIPKYSLRHRPYKTGTGNSCCYWAPSVLHRKHS